MFFSLIVLFNSFVKKPITMTQRFPKFNCVIGIWVEKSPKFIRDSYCMDLIKMQWIFEDLHRVNEISDNDNFTDPLKICCLVNAASNGKKFDFSSCDVNCRMNHLNDLLVLTINVSYWHGDLVLNACVRDNQSNRWVKQWSKSNIIERLEMSFEIVVTTIS